MPLFYLLSGYFFQPVSPLRPFFQKKALTLLLPYVFFLLFDLFIFYILYNLSGEADQIFISPGIAIHPYGVATPLWFLLSLFEVIVIYRLIVLVVKNKWLQWGVVVLLFYAGYYLSQFSIHLPLYADSSLSMILFFHTGYCLNHQLIRSMSLKWKYLLAYGGGILFVAGILLQVKIDIKINVVDQRSLLFLVVALGACWAIMVFSEWLAKFSNCLTKCLTVIGKDSLYIFALHMLCFEIIKVILPMPENEKWIYGWGIILLIGGIALSWLISLGIKKWLMALQRFFYKRFVVETK